MTEGPRMRGVGDAVLVVEGARKSYGHTAVGRRDAVDDVSFEVRERTIHGLLGPNGAGKTTTLKMLLGLVRPTAGRFEIRGVPAAAKGARRAVGFLPEQPYFPALLTAGEYLDLSGALAGMSRPEIAASSAVLLDRVGLHGRETTRLSRFSRGMLQRLGLAAALLGDPSVIVLDEPASGLDPVGQRDVRNLMQELKGEGVAVLLSSHQLSEVEAVCDEVTIVDRGRVAARGHIDDLLNVAGQTSVKASGSGELPEGIRSLARDVATNGGVWTFSVDDGVVRAVVDGLDDAAWRILSVMPKRESLEDYFARMLSDTAGGSGVLPVSPEKEVDRDA